MAEQRKLTRGPRASPITPKNSGGQQYADVVQTHKGRKTGKRSDPAFRPTTVFVRKETQRKATRLLEDQDTGKDFSDLVEELVSNWITKHSHV